MGTLGSVSPPGSSQTSPDSLCSLHELVKHEENGLVFEDSEELAAQLQVACLLPHCGLQGFGDSLFLQLGGWPWAVYG